MSVLETLSGLLNSRKQAKTLMAELKARGLVIMEEEAASLSVEAAAEILRRRYKHDFWMKGLDADNVIRALRMSPMITRANIDDDTLLERAASALEDEECPEGFGRVQFLVRKITSFAPGREGQLEALEVNG